MDDTLAEVAANTLMYKCCICDTRNLSRDEVMEVRKDDGTIHYICDRCKSSIINFQTEDTE